jgi:heme exporter protein D
MSEFFEMGGYGAYIWPCYGVSAVLMVGILVSSIRSLQNNRATLTGLEEKISPVQENKE